MKKLLKNDNVKIALHSLYLIPAFAVLGVVFLHGLFPIMDKLFN